MADKGMKMEGWLFKKPDKGIVKKWKKRWFLAEQSKMSYFDTPKGKPLGVVDLKEVNGYATDSAKDTDDKYYFSLTVPGRIYWLYSQKDQERQQWIDHIGKYAPPEAKGKVGSKKNELASSSSSSQAQSQQSTVEPKININQNATNVEYTQHTLTQFPASFFNCKAVEIANFSENSITAIPTTISNLKTLKVLNLSYNKISSLPNEICLLANLEELNLHSNLLSTLPDSIGDLTKLQLLWVSQNSITQLPASIGKLSNLQKLSIAYNTGEPDEEADGQDEEGHDDQEEGQVLALPEELCSCSSMVWLDISGNGISKFPEFILKYANLQVLEATNNRFQTVPEELGTLANLQQLRLSHNLLKELPASLGSLQSLQELEVSFNKLNTLPPAFGKSKAFIEVHDNPFNDLPKDVVDKGSNAIKKYLRDTQQ